MAHLLHPSIAKREGRIGARDSERDLLPFALVAVLHDGKNSHIKCRRHGQLDLCVHTHPEVTGANLHFKEDMERNTLLSTVGYAANDHRCLLSSPAWTVIITTEQLQTG